MRIFRLLIIAHLAALLASAHAQTLPATTTAPAKINDLAGNPLELPAPTKVAVLIFLQPGQEQSRRQLADARKELAPFADALQIVALVSGPDAAKRARTLADCPWPLVPDDDYTLSGRYNIHAWPTTIVLGPQNGGLKDWPGGRLPGWSVGYATRLPAYVAFAQGKSTRDQLDRALADVSVVQDSTDQKASRHLILAERLLQSDRRDDAEAQLKDAQDLAPAAPELRLRLARAELLLGQAQAADDLLHSLDPAALPADTPAGQLPLLRAWSAMASGRWSDADVKAPLLSALKAGADPAETYYRLGLYYTHQNDALHAADSFRRACESTPLKRLAP